MESRFGKICSTKLTNNERPFQESLQYFAMERFLYGFPISPSRGAHSYGTACWHNGSIIEGNCATCGTGGRRGASAPSAPHAGNRRTRGSGPSQPGLTSATIPTWCQTAMCCPSDWQEGEEIQDDAALYSPVRGIQTTSRRESTETGRYGGRVSQKSPHHPKQPKVVAFGK